MNRCAEMECSYRAENDCCKQFSCNYSPGDFHKITFDSLVKAYRQGKIMLKIVNHEYIIVKAPMKNCTRLNRGEDEIGECVFHRRKKCNLSLIHRPYGGKVLELCKMKRRDSLYQEERAGREWRMYQPLLMAVFIYLLSDENFDGESFDHTQCKACGGACCKSAGCYFAPSDFKELNFDAMKKILNKGYISIASVPKEYSGLKKDVYVLKMRDAYDEVCEEVEHYAGGCILHDIDTGCPFSDEDRPYGGKALKPELFLGKGCSVGYNSRMCAEDWWPYQKLLKKLYTEFERRHVVYTGL